MNSQPKPKQPDDDRSQGSGEDPQTEGDLPDSEPGGENRDAGASPGTDQRRRGADNGWDDVEGGAGPRRGDEPAAP